MTNNEQSDEGSDLETFTDEDSNTNNSFELKRKVRQTAQENGISQSNGEKEKNLSHERVPCPGDEATWESFLGESEEKSTILIRWPDGSRDNWCQPSDSQLKSLLLFIESNGFNLEHYEVVTNFPRKQIDSLVQESSLKTHGLFPRETVFVHLRDN